jgi:hypothetical protein
MSTIDDLLAKRAELASQVQGLQSAIFHIDATLSLLGHTARPKVSRRFAPGELLALVGEAERAGCDTPTKITTYILAAKGFGSELRGKVMFSVKDARKRLNARGV